MDSLEDSPAAFAGRLLFEPISPWLEHFAAPGLPTHAALNAIVEPELRSGGGAPIRFAPPAGDLEGYEAHIFTSGEVPTRSDDWHDFFNALAWCAWPRSKARCNSLHMAALHARRKAGLTGRGPQRDALTQFDECGIVVVSSMPELLQGLANHAWEEVFWQQRARLIATTRFLVFGHGTWDQLRAPFFGLCAKAIYREVAPCWHTLSATAQLTDTDDWLAAHLDTHAATLTPRSLSPLPLLGIPGLTADNTRADYYRDSRQFRPRRSSAIHQPS